MGRIEDGPGPRRRRSAGMRKEQERDMIYTRLGAQVIVAID